jgi:hypothetical protein
VHEVQEGSKVSTEQKIIRFGDLTFREVIRENCIYADKTKYIYDMIKLSKCCFLSRPRRFGKTLLLRTVEELFRGDRELFRGLWIDTSDFPFEKHPVLKMDMTFTEVKTSDDLVSAIKRKLRGLADDNGVALDAVTYSEMLHQLVRRLSDKHGTGVVILIDEYDAPVTEHILNLDLALANRDVMHNFFRSIKTSVEYIHFAFVTGITRFAMVFLDSGPNNFFDISLEPDFAGICGFTPTELETCFSDRFHKTLGNLIDKGKLEPDADFTKLTKLILDYYDGYNWLGPEKVLNPFSILKLFYSNKIDIYWPLSGRPSYLTSLIRKNPIDYLFPMDICSSVEAVEADLKKINAISALFHSGYLTIKDETTITQKIFGRDREIPAFRFMFPNEEVILNYHNVVFTDVFRPDHDYISNMTNELPNALIQKNSDKVASLLHDLLTSISYTQHLTSEELRKNDQLSASEDHTKTEKYYHAILHGSFLSAGFEVHSQGSSGHGISDITLFLNDRFRIVIELKYCNFLKNFDQDPKFSKTDWARMENERMANEISATVDKAEKQVRELDYAGPYRAAGCKVICMALVISDRDRVEVRFFEY